LRECCGAEWGKNHRVGVPGFNWLRPEDCREITAQRPLYMVTL